MPFKKRRGLNQLYLVLVTGVFLVSSMPVQHNRTNFVEFCDDKCISEQNSSHYGVEGRLVIDELNNNDNNSEDWTGDEEEDDVGEEGDYFEGDIILGDEHILNTTVRRITIH